MKKGGLEEMRNSDDALPSYAGHPDYSYNPDGSWGGINGNKTGQICPRCGYDCWSVRYIEQPGGTVCLCTCCVCTHCAQVDGRIPPQIVITKYPSEISCVQSTDVCCPKEEGQPAGEKG